MLTAVFKYPYLYTYLCVFVGVCIKILPDTGLCNLGTGTRVCGEKRPSFFILYFFIQFI